MIKIKVEKEFNVSLVTACIIYLDLFMVDYAEDGNGSFNIEDLNKFLKKTTRESFIIDVETWIENEFEETELDIDGGMPNLFSDATHTNGFSEVYHHVAEMFFNGK